MYTHDGYDTLMWWNICLISRLFEIEYPLGKELDMKPTTTKYIKIRENGRDLTQSYDKSPYTQSFLSRLRTNNQPKRKCHKNVVHKHI